DGSVGARRLGVAEAGEGAGETERREGVGAAHRIVGVDRVERQRVDAAGGQGAIRLVADAYERLRVIRLAGAAGAGDRLAEIVRRPKPLRAVALLLDETVDAVVPPRVVGGAVRLVGKPRVERPVDGEGAPDQRTIGRRRV